MKERTRQAFIREIPDWYQGLKMLEEGAVEYKRMFIQMIGVLDATKRVKMDKIYQNRYYKSRGNE